METHLVQCVPFSTRLTEHSCAERHRLAQRATHPLRLTACRGCALGSVRAGGTPAPADSYEIGYAWKRDRVPVQRVGDGRYETLAEREKAAAILGAVDRRSA